MTIYVLLHFKEVVGCYSSEALADLGKTEGYVSTLDPTGWCIQEWPLDKFLTATLKGR